MNLLLKLLVVVEFVSHVTVASHNSAASAGVATPAGFDLMGEGTCGFADCDPSFESSCTDIVADYWKRHDETSANTHAEWTANCAADARNAGTAIAGFTVDPRGDCYLHPAVETSIPNMAQCPSHGTGCPAPSQFGTWAHSLGSVIDWEFTKYAGAGQINGVYKISSWSCYRVTPPTAAPTEPPTESPTKFPTTFPSPFPTAIPTPAPSNTPTVSPFRTTSPTSAPVVPAPPAPTLAYTEVYVKQYDAVLSGLTHVELDNANEAMAITLGVDHHQVTYTATEVSSGSASPSNDSRRRLERAEKNEFRRRRLVATPASLPRVTATANMPTPGQVSGASDWEVRYEVVYATEDEADAAPADANVLAADLTATLNSMPNWTPASGHVGASVTNISPVVSKRVLAPTPAPVVGGGTDAKVRSGGAKTRQFFKGEGWWLRWEAILVYVLAILVIAAVIKLVKNNIESCKNESDRPTASGIKFHQAKQNDDDLEKNNLKKPNQGQMPVTIALPVN